VRGESSSTTGTGTPTSQAAGGRCSGGAKPANPIAETEQVGDFDGNGKEDRLFAYGTGSKSAPAPWHVRMELAGGGVVDSVIDDATDAGNVRALGAADITSRLGQPPDGTGDEAFVEVGAGASAAIVGIYQLKDCQLTRVTGPAGAGASAFAVGGSITHLDGLHCQGPDGGERLVVLSAVSEDGAQYQTTDQALDIANGAFVPSGAPLVGSLAAGGAVSAYGVINCEGVESP
jgi:hypothetical protein